MPLNKRTKTFDDMGLHPFGLGVMGYSPDEISFVEVEEVGLVVGGDGLLKLLEEPGGEFGVVLLCCELRLDGGVVRDLVQVDVEIQVFGKC